MTPRRRRVLRVLGAPLRFFDWLLWPDPLTLGLAWLVLILAAVLAVLILLREGVL